MCVSTSRGPGVNARLALNESRRFSSPRDVNPQERGEYIFFRLRLVQVHVPGS